MLFETKLMISKQIKILSILVISLCLVIVSIFFVRACLGSGTVEEKIVKYQYAQKANLDYQVFLKPNLLYEGNILGSGQIYPTIFVDQLQTTLTYEFSGDKEANIKGNYSVVATVQGVQKEENKEKVLWSKDFLLVPQTFFASANGKVKFKEEVPLSLDAFNQFVEQVQKASEIISNVNLAVNWRILVEAENEEGSVKEEFTPQLTLPLCKKYFEVRGDLAPEKTGALEEIVATKVPVNKIKAILLGLGILFCLLALVFLVHFVEVVTPSLLEKQVKAIFKKYGERLVALDEEGMFSGEIELKVKSMEDLVHIADEICSPVYYYVKKVRSEESLSFYVFNEERIFTYDLGVEKMSPSFFKGDALPYL